MPNKISDKKEDWMQRRWRPMMAALYMLVCAFDFIIAPVLWSLIQATYKGQITSQWQPLTLQGAGLFHLAMGAILGITAYGRTQEKLNNVSNNNFGMSSGFQNGNQYNNQPSTINQPTLQPNQMINSSKGKSGPAIMPDEML